MPLSKEVLPIVEALSRATAEGRVNWREAGNFYSVVFPRSSLRLWRYHEDDHGGPEEGISVELINEKGQSVGVDIVAAGEGMQYAMLDGMLEKAGRLTRGLGEVARDILTEINQGGSVGTPVKKILIVE